MEPVSHEFRLVDRAGLPRQDQERGLEGILRRVPVADDLLADSQYHRPVPAHQGGKSSLGRVDVDRFTGQPRGVLRWLLYPKLVAELL